SLAGRIFPKPEDNVLNLARLESSGTLVETVNGNGTIQPRDTLVVSTDQSGVVIDVRHNRGDVVEEGEELLRLDDRIPQQRLAQARAALATAQALLAAADPAIDEATKKAKWAETSLQQFKKETFSKLIEGEREQLKIALAASVEVAKAAKKTSEERVNEAE